MEISPYMLTLLLIYSFLFGVFAGAVYDVSKILRALLFEGTSTDRQKKLCDIKLVLVGKLTPKRNSNLLPIFVFIFDILIFLFIGCGIAVLNFYFNRGQMRLYTITAVAVGFLVYYFTLGKIVSFFADWLVFALRAVMAILARLLIAPFAALGKGLEKIVSLWIRKITFALEKKSMIRYNEREEKRLLKLAELGFAEESKKEG
jgi:hypothetical protein